MEPQIWVAIISLGGFLLTGIFSVIVAMLNSRREKEATAETAADKAAEKASLELEKTLRERLILRDEQIELLQQKITELTETVADLRRQIERLTDATER